MPPTHRNYPPWEILVKSLERAIENNEFSSEKFFPIWFREYGTPYFFLFKKNLSVTNIQHAELLALVRQHIVHKETRAPVSAVAFHNTAAFTQTLDDIISSAVEVVHYTTELLRETAKLYWPIVEKSVVIDSFYTSCAIFLPPHLDLDIVRVCAESGYIHSCGYSLFIRKLNKAKKVHFYDAIDRHLAKYSEYRGSLQFVPYSAEDFGDDKGIGHVKDALQDGIEGVKIRVEKLHMADLPLVKILDDMKGHFKSRLLFHEAGPYKEKHPSSSASTLWLISDHSINRSNPRTAGADRYFLCYHQLYANYCPFHFFDENKPAWVAHTTIPHTLLGAMLNITKPWPSNRVISIGDPFGGTGTTWLEAKKSEQTCCIVGDLNPMLPLLIEDNARFFSLSPQELREQAVSLQQLADRMRTRDKAEAEDISGQTILLDDGDSRFDPAYQQASSLIERLRADKKAPIQSFDFPQTVVDEIANYSLFERLVLYVSLRAEIRFQLAYARGAKKRTTAFADSAAYLLEEIESLIEWSTRLSSTRDTVGPFAISSGHYSKSCSIRPEIVKEAAKSVRKSSELFIRDARNIEPRTYDIIVTDPPYGFNTEEELLGLSRLYAEVIEKLVAAIRNDGHLVVCLPNEALTGRSLPVCTKSKIVIAQVLRAADSLNREIYIPASSNLPLTAPPYYWNSSALRRTILHFRIRDRPQ